MHDAVAREAAQAAIDLAQPRQRRRVEIDQELVERAIVLAVEQVNAARRAVAPGAPGLLIELGEIEVEMVEHDVAHVGQVDALAERRGRDDDAQPALAKEPLDLRALGVRHPAVIEHHLVAELFAQPLARPSSPRARVAVDDALLPLLVALRKSSVR